MTSTFDERALSEQLDAIFSSAVKEAEAEFQERLAFVGRWGGTVSAERQTAMRNQAMRNRLLGAVNEARLVVGEAVFRKSKQQLRKVNEVHLVMGKEVGSHPLMAAFMQKVADVLPPAGVAPAEAKAKRPGHWTNQLSDNAHDNSGAQQGNAIVATVDERALSERLDAIFASAVNEAKAQFEARVADAGTWYTVTAECRTEMWNQIMRDRLLGAVNEARLVVGAAVFQKTEQQLRMNDEAHLVMRREVGSHPLMVAFMQKVADVLPPANIPTAEARAKAERARLWVKNRAGDNTYDISNTQVGKDIVRAGRIGAVVTLIMTAVLFALLLHGIFTGEVKEMSRYSKKMVSRDLDPVMFWIVVCYRAFAVFFFAGLTYAFSNSAGWVRRLEKNGKILDGANRVASVFPTNSSKVPPWVAVLVIGFWFILLFLILPFFLPHGHPLK